MLKLVIKINISSSDTNSESDHGSDDSNSYFIPDHDMEVESHKAVIVKATKASMKWGIPMSPCQMKSG